jgi:hypothetical protein
LPLQSTAAAAAPGVSHWDLKKMEEHRKAMTVTFKDIETAIVRFDSLSLSDIEILKSKFSATDFDQPLFCSLDSIID